MDALIDDRTPPHDELAERTMLGIALTMGRVPEAASDLIPADFYQPRHEYLWAMFRELVGAGKACDANTVRARIMERGEIARIDNLAYLIDLLRVIPASDPVSLAEIIVDRSLRRHIGAAATSTLQAVHESAADAETLLQEAERRLAKVPSRDSGNVDSLSTLDEFLAGQEAEPEWVLPGLLARDERAIITGTEGLGKTTLIRQLAVCAAAGIDPFTGRRIPPMTVLAIDAENPKYIMQTRYRELLAAVRAHGSHIDETRFWLDNRPAGLDLADAADRRWLEKRVRMVRPDLLVIGPAYKLHDAGNDDKDEVIARTVTSVLDQVRTDAGCALILEHHAGNGNEQGPRPVRPFGSSLWRRWPEFGFGIRPSKHPEAEARRLVDVVHWRGGRDVRAWPKQMESAAVGMPWVETVAELGRAS